MTCKKNPYADFSAARASSTCFSAFSWSLKLSTHLPAALNTYVWRPAVTWQQEMQLSAEAAVRAIHTHGCSEDQALRVHSCLFGANGD